MNRLYPIMLCKQKQIQFPVQRSAEDFSFELDHSVDANLFLVYDFTPLSSTPSLKINFPTKTVNKSIQRLESLLTPVSNHFTPWYPQPRPAARSQNNNCEK